MPDLTLDLNQSLESNLQTNNIITKTGGRRKKRVGGEDTPAPAPVEEQKQVLTVSFLKTAYDFLLDKGTKVGTIVGEVAVAGAMVYAANQMFGPDVCSPFYGSVSKTLATYVPIAAGPSLKCDTAASTYHNALTSAMLIAGPILVDAFKRAGKLVLSDAQVEEIGGEMIEIIQNPAAAAVASVSAFKRRGSLPSIGNVAGPSTKFPPPPPKNTLFAPKTGGGRRTKKGGKKKMRKTHRKPLFKY